MSNSTRNKLTAGQKRLIEEIKKDAETNPFILSAFEAQCITPLRALHKELADLRAKYSIPAKDAQDTEIVEPGASQVVSSDCAEAAFSKQMNDAQQQLEQHKSGRLPMLEAQESKLQRLRLIAEKSDSKTMEEELQTLNESATVEADRELPGRLD